ncbi:hypothetical protein [Myxococcus faecalis]|uniref:hypothetical protein n=1 Tax=Myxococcus faecalis TaxID=3115646 RepID=UPI003CECCE03
MTFAAPALDESTGLKVGVTVNAAHAQKRFAGAPHSFQGALALERRQPLSALRADEGKRDPLPEQTVTPPMRAR